MLDLNAIPPAARNKNQIALHLELYNRSMDTIRVHNPTNKDYYVYNNKMVAKETYIVPANTRDLGYGKGNNDVPRFIADRYLEHMGLDMIHKKIEADWDKKKMQFRLEERGDMEGKLALRSSDPKLWDEVTPILWKGVISRYQSEAYDEPQEKPERKEYSSPAEEALDRLGLKDTDMGVSTEVSELLNNDTRDLEHKKDQFIDSIQ